MTFKESYAQLNPEQKKAVDTIEGPVMVVAGPGTGKTQILTLRIANILQQTDTEPENILALTFTEAAAANMRKRLVSLVGSIGYRVVIATFHGFANDIIQQNPEDFPNIIGAAPITEVEQITILEDIITDSDLALLRPFGDTFFYVRSIMRSIGDLKREGVTPHRFAEIVERERRVFDAIPDKVHEKGAHAGKVKGVYREQEKLIAKNEELVGVYRRYQERLRSDRKYDFTDMLIELVEALKTSEDLLLRLQEEYQYLLVDEHQDSNNAQNAILELLASYHEDYPNLFVVGDEKQSIFRFQGASLENFYYFKDRYPKAELVTLTTNYRSSQVILDSAGSMMSAQGSLIAHHDYEPHKITVAAFPDHQSEHYGVGQAIKGLIGEGTEPREIAVLYRNNKDAFPMARMLGKLGVPFEIESDQDIFADPLVRRLITLLRAVQSFGDDVALIPALHLDVFDLDPLDVFKVTRAAKAKQKLTLYDIIKDIKRHAKDISIEKPEAFSEAYAKLAVWAKRAQKEDLETLVELIIRESGMLSEALGSDDSYGALDALSTFFDEVRGLSRGTHYTLDDFFGHLAKVDEHNLMVRKKKAGGKTDAVRLMTAHKSKGLEFEHVFIIHAVSGVWGNTRKPNPLKLLPGVYMRLDDADHDGVIDAKETANDDERRLFYVALTRAKKRVMVSYPEQGPDGRELVVSQYLTEIRDDLKEFIDTTATVKELAKDGSLVLAPVSLDTASLSRHRDFVQTLFGKQALSVSALNNYLKSPWQYFFKNLVRVPTLRNKYQAYGTAVHAAIDDMFKFLRAGEMPNTEEFLARFDHHLDNEFLRSVDHQDAQDKGHEILPNWLEETQSRWEPTAQSEFRIAGVRLDWGSFVDKVPSEFVDGIRLMGVLDLVELDDPGGSSVRVVDFKTGKPKSRNEILGKTKNATGDYYRQLVFYKLLLRLFAEGKYHMDEGEIHFIEPNERGVFKKEVFTISDEEVDELADTIRTVALEILNLDFWDRPCDPDACEFCDLRDALV